MMIYLLSRTISGGGHETNTWATPPDLEPAIQHELTVLASIEARYRHELASLERFGSLPRRAKSIFGSNLRPGATPHASRTS